MEEGKREKDKERVMEIEGDRRSDGLKNSRGRIQKKVGNIDK